MGSDDQIFQHSCYILNNVSSEEVCRACRYHNTLSWQNDHWPPLLWYVANVTVAFGHPQHLHSHHSPLALVGEDSEELCQDPSQRLAREGPNPDKWRLWSKKQLIQENAIWHFSPNRIQPYITRAYSLIEYRDSMSTYRSKNGTANIFGRI